MRDPILERHLPGLIRKNLPFLEALVAIGRGLAAEHPQIAGPYSIPPPVQQEATPVVGSKRSPLIPQPAIFVVLQDGKAYGPLSEDELQHRDWPPCNLIFDTTRNEISIRHRDEKATRLVLLGRQMTASRARSGHARRQAAVACNPGGGILTILRTLMEHPGVRFTERVMFRHTGHHCHEKTFAKYIERIRELLGDTETKFPLILTDHEVDGFVSETHSAYYADPESRFRVVRYTPEVSPRNPPPHPLP